MTLRWRGGGERKSQSNDASALVRSVPRVTRRPYFQEHRMRPASAIFPSAPEDTPDSRLANLRALEQKVLWLSVWMIHHANHLRPKDDGLKVGGHQASSASMVTLMTALYFDV